MVVGTRRSGAHGKEASGTLSAEEHFCIAKYRCVARKQGGMTLELLRSGCCTNQPKQPKAQSFFIFSSVRRKGISLLLTRVMLK